MRRRPSLLECYAVVGLPIEAALYSLGLGLIVVTLSLAWAFYRYRP